MLTRSTGQRVDEVQGALQRPKERMMAGGWAKDGAVNDQIEDSIRDELARMAARKRPAGESLTECAECGEPIPEARRAALPGVKLCVECQTERDRRFVSRPGFNRRGSKDSQLK